MGDGSMFDQRLGGTVLVDEQIRLLTLVDIFDAVALAAEIAFGFGARASPATSWRRPTSAGTRPSKR
jgi:hypothetical protein